MTATGRSWERMTDSFKKFVKSTPLGAYYLKKRDEQWRDKETSVKKMLKLWDRLSRKSSLGFISHLQKGAHWDEGEFHLVGIRFVDRIVERLVDYGEVEPSYANILEIGCGVGRFLKPISCRFMDVVGVDISQEMLNTAKSYLKGLPNVTLLLNDGTSLKTFDDESFDYCFSAGVFQHITHVDVIIDYVKEAVRVLKPGGLFLFQFVGSRTERVGRGQTGAKIVAAELDAGLRNISYVIREVSVDPQDPIRNVVIVIQKPKAGQRVIETERSFVKYPMTERRWLSGVYDDVTTRTRMHERLKQGAEKLTFYS